MISRWMTTSASRCVDLVPGVADRIKRLPEGERFEWIWSILGSESVRAALRDTHALNMMRKAVELRIITEPRQITYLDIDSLECLSRVLDRYPRTETPRSCRCCGRHWPAHRHRSRVWWKRSPSGMRAPKENVARLLAQDGLPTMLAAADQWLSGPALLPIVLRAVDPAFHNARWPRQSVGSGHESSPTDRSNPTNCERHSSPKAPSGFPNSLKSVGESEPDELYIGVLQHLFRPVSLTYTQTAKRTAAHCRLQSSRVSERPETRWGALVGAASLLHVRGARKRGGGHQVVPV